jgi:hypothetical protein
MRCRATIRSEGRIFDVRRYFARKMGGGEARFEPFDLDPDGKVLDLEVGIAHRLGEIRFETEPPDAAVTFRVALEGSDGPVGILVRHAASEAPPSKLSPETREHLEALGYGE